MKVTGKIHLIGEVKQVSEKFKSLDIVVETDEKYPQFLSLQLSQSNVSLADNLKVGQVVEVAINLKGRKWTSPGGEVKYFNTIEAWQITATPLIKNTGEEWLPI